MFIYKIIFQLFKPVILSLLMLISISAITNAQSWRVGFGYSLNLNNDPNDVHFFTGNGYHVNDFKLNFRLGMSIERLWMEKFSINSGIYYAQNNYNADLSCESCLIENENKEAESYTNFEPKDFNKSYLEIPITARYYFINKKLTVFADVGIINNFMLELNQFPERGYYLNVVGGAGLGLALSESWFLESNLKYTTQILTLYNNSNYIQKLLRIELGVKKEF